MTTIPKYDDFALPTLQALEALGGSASNDELQEHIAEAMGLSQDQLDQTYAKSGAPIVPDRMSWARSYLKLAGFASSQGRGVWAITDAGREASRWSSDEVKRRIADAFNAHERQRKQAKAADRETAADVAVAAEEADAAWSDQLLAMLRAMDPAAFERLCQRLLRESGFVKVEVTGRSGDGGIDGTGVLRMNLISFHVLFQCKRYAGSVSSPTVRDFRGAMQGRADKGLILTTGSFTADARREATRDGAPAIDLIDGETLCQLLKERGLGVRVRPVVVEEVTVEPGFFAEI
jgi:restriction system protein